MPTDAERNAVLKERERRRLLRKGVGLYTYEQERNTTPFQLAAQIVVGAVLLITGLILFFAVWSVRAREISDYGTATSHLGGFAASAAIVLIGIFFAHAGVIFYLESASPAKLQIFLQVSQSTKVSKFLLSSKVSKVRKSAA